MLIIKGFMRVCLAETKRRCDSVHPLHFCPCSVAQSTRLPLMQETTGSRRGGTVRDASLFALKALLAMPSLGKRTSPVQFRVGAPFRSRASAQVGFISPLCPGQHRRLRPFPPPRSSLRISFVKNSCRSITGWRLHSICSRSPMQRHDVEIVASAGALLFAPRTVPYGATNL